MRRFARPRFRLDKNTSAWTVGIMITQQNIFVAVMFEVVCIVDPLLLYKLKRATNTGVGNHDDCAVLPVVAVRSRKLGFHRVIEWPYNAS